jgi:hypothetical protein
MTTVLICCIHILAWLKPYRKRYIVNVIYLKTEGCLLTYARAPASMTILFLLVIYKFKFSIHGLLLMLGMQARKIIA